MDEEEKKRKEKIEEKNKEVEVELVKLKEKQQQESKAIETKKFITLSRKDTSTTQGISMLYSFVNLRTPISTLASYSSSLVLVNIDDVVVSLGDYLFSKSHTGILKRDSKGKRVE